jgi:hypothetical protein
MTSPIRSRVPFDEYKAVPALNISALKELKRSPLHYRHALTHPRTTKPMTLGTAAHVATLEPERFSRDYAIWSRRTESGRMAPRAGKLWEAFAAEAAAEGRQVLTEDECSTALAIAAAVRSDPVAAKYLEAGDPEVTLRWQFGDRPCKGRVDWLTTMDGEPVIVGLKTARDCRHFIFASAAAKLGYPEQWAWYFNGYQAITGRDARMVEIVVESEPPHAAIAYVITEDVLAQGRDNYLNLMRQLEECERRDEWPGPAQTELVLSMPSWFYGGADGDIGEIDLEE